MQSGFACRRCLIQLVQTPPRGPTPKLRHVPKRRWISTSRITVPRIGAHQRRALSGLQGQAVENERPITVPPGLQSAPVPNTSKHPLLQPSNLFHAFSNSPSPQIRRRAAFIKQHAYCPHPSHRPTRQPQGPHDEGARRAGTEPPKLVRFECPDCGIPVSCSEDHWADDYESHLEICDQLREINEDDHDLRSGRFFPEFEYPGPQMEEALVNMTNWDTYLYSREYRAINDPRSMRQVTRLLTYPITVGSVLHELSPYNIRQGGRLTTEGLKSLSGTTSSPVLIYTNYFIQRFDTPSTHLVQVEAATM